MKIEIEKTTATGPATIKLSHGSKSMLWDTSAYAKSNDRRVPVNPEHIFKDINAFWATLTQSEQTAYWDLYVEARNVFDNVFDMKEIQRQLQDIVKRLLDVPSLEKMQHWVIYRSGILIPSEVKESFEETNGAQAGYLHRREKTYLRGEYVDLTIMTVTLRLMVPIWAEFIKITRRQTGSNTKELEAYRLLYFSRVHNSAAMTRLQQYVQVTVDAIQGPDNNNTAILNGMGVVEFYDWMLALAVVRRLAICPISAEPEISNIITNVHQYVKVNVKSAPKKHSKKFGGKVTLRKANEVGDDGQKKTSAEVYKIKQEVPDGIKVLQQVYFDDPRISLYRSLGLTRRGSMDLVMEKPDGLDARLNACLAWISQVPDFEVMPHHITLIQWTLSPIFSPRAVPLLTLDALKRALAVTQTILWEWDFYDLAALVSAKPYVVDDDMMVGASETRGRIPKEMLDDLNRRWPYIQQTRGKQSFRQSNVAAKAIDAICDSMTMSDWVLLCPNELVEKVSRQGLNRRFSIPSDIRWTLSSLLIKIETLIAQEEVTQV